MTLRLFILALTDSFSGCYQPLNSPTDEINMINTTNKTSESPFPHSNSPTTMQRSIPDSSTNTMFRTQSAPEENRNDAPFLQRIYSFDEECLRDQNEMTPAYRNLSVQPEIFHFLDWKEDSSLDGSEDDNIIDRNFPKVFIPISSQTMLDSSEDAIVAPRIRLMEQESDDDCTVTLDPMNTTAPSTVCSNPGEENDLIQYFCEGIQRQESGVQKQHAAVQVVKINEENRHAFPLPQTTLDHILDFSIQMSLSYYNQKTNRTPGGTKAAKIPKYIYIRREGRWRRQLGRSWSRLLSRNRGRSSSRMGEF